jgi:acetyl-CoA acetyltransferase
MSGKQAFEHAGLTPVDIDHLMLYDAFSPTPMYFLEDLGFVPKGEVGPWLADTARDENGRIIYKTGPGGALPMNTNGGGLSFGHSGRYGMFAMLEAVFQLRGQAGARQIAGIETSLVHGPGRQFAAASTLILGRG